MLPNIPFFGGELAEGPNEPPGGLTVGGETGGEGLLGALAEIFGLPASGAVVCLTRFVVSFSRSSG
jgi:hypothetical protein